MKNNIIDNFELLINNKSKSQLQENISKLLDNKIKMISDSDDTIVEMTSIRKTIARKMDESWKQIIYTNLAVEIDVTELWNYRNKIKEYVFKKEKVKLNLLPFIVKAVAKATKTFPNFNAIIDDKTNTLVVKKQVNVGIAADTKDGLIVPNIKDVNNLSIVEIGKQISELAEKARNKKIQFVDLANGTISISNIGSVGASFSLPVIKYPEVAIVSISSLHSKLKKDVSFYNKMCFDSYNFKNYTIERKVMYLVVAVDKRWIDNKDIANFLKLIKEYLENWMLLFI